MRMGFLVNPIAGLGGKVGLKGSDNVAREALRMGAKPVAPQRGFEFLKKLKELELHQQLTLLTCPTVMGERVVRSVGLSTCILPMQMKSQTTADDTKEAVRLMVERKVDLISFVGGDGTARDILDALGSYDSTPVLGIPSGVKMYSGIFAVHPSDAAFIVEAFLREEVQLVDFEVIDADETAIRRGCFNIRLYGFLKGPFVPAHIQGSKQASPETLDEHENQMAIARFIVEGMDRGAAYILAPGTTVKGVADLLGITKTLLGVDVYRDDGVMLDVNEERMLREIADWQRVWIIVSPIGRQGILFGRGNQQISPAIIQRVGKEKIIVMATKGKIRGFEGGVLRVDTGNIEVDSMLRGYIRVATDYREWRLLKVN